MSYTLTDLGPHQNYSYDPRFRGTTVYSVQDRATGGKFDTHAAYWDGAWSLLPDPDLGIHLAVAEDGITDLIVGHITLNSTELYGHAMIWTQSAGTWTATSLPMPTGALSSSAVAVSSDGTRIVGEVDFGFFNIAAALWTNAGGIWTVEVMPKPDLRASSIGFDDATGDVIGTLLDRPIWRAVRWHYDGSAWVILPLDLPTAVPPPLPSEVSTTAEGFADGITVGWATLGSGPSQAVRWFADGTIEDLGVGDGTIAYGTRGGVVVGTKPNGNYETGFVWTQAGGVEDIHPAGYDWSLPSGVDVNGRIIGTMGTGAMTSLTGTRNFFLLTPDP